MTHTRAHMWQLVGSYVLCRFEIQKEMIRVPLLHLLS